MPDFQTETSILRVVYADLAGAAPETVGAVLARHRHPDGHWRGMHPFSEQHGAAAVAQAFWSPLLAAISRARRRPDIFMVGRNEIGGFKSVWVVSIGHLMRLFDRPWLGFRPTGKIVMLRPVAFHKVAGGKGGAGRITETAQFFDIPHLMILAGQNPFAAATGTHMAQPGLLPHKGQMSDAQNAAKRTAYQAHLARTWADDMIRWGPCRHRCGMRHPAPHVPACGAVPCPSVRRLPLQPPSLPRGKRALRRLFRSGEPVLAQQWRRYGHDRLARHDRLAGGRPVPPNGWHAGREPDFHQHSALSEPAGSGRSGPYGVA